MTTTDETPDLHMLQAYWGYLEFRQEPITFGADMANMLGADIGKLCVAVRKIRAELAEAQANRVPDGGTWAIDYGHDPGRPTVHGIEWHPGLHCVRDNYQRRVWYGPTEPVASDEPTP